MIMLVLCRFELLAIALTVAALTGLSACAGSKVASADPEPQSIAEVEGKQLTHHFEGLTVQSAYGCAIADGGILWCWGHDPALRLGLRRDESDLRKATRVSGLDSVAQVVSARSSIHETTCVLSHGAEVYCWGIGPRGRKIGVHPIQGLANVEQLAAQRDVCARTKEGAVYCWSPDGEGPRAQPQRILDGAIDIGSGYMNCALDAGGVVRCWGGGLSGQFNRISRIQGDRWSRPKDDIAIMATVQGAVEVEVGMHNLCVRRTTGEVLCALPPGAEEIHKPPPLALEPIPGSDEARVLSLSDQHGCVVDRHGGVRCWGSNAWAQLGDGSSLRRDREPVTVAGLDDIEAVAAAATLSCSMTEWRVARGGSMTESEIQCWGTFGADDFDHRDVESHVLPFRSQEIQAVDYLTCALDEDGKTRCWGPRAAHGSTFAKHKFFDDPGGIMAASTPTELPVQLRGIRAMYNEQSLCLLDADHTLICGRFEHSKWRGDFATLPDQRFQIESREAGVLDIESGPGPALVLLQATKPRLEARSAGTVRRDIKKVPPFQDIIDSTGGVSHACVAHGGGVVDCWDPFGYANDKNKKVQRVPGLSDAAGVIDLPWTARNCAWTRRGKVLCWGLAQRPYELLPAKMIEIDEISDVVELVASQDELCARQGSGALACAPLGRESIGKWRRVDVPPVVLVTAGKHHICMIHHDGETRCIGDNAYGQLGGLSARTMPVPTPIVFVD